jgi:hypothetical protein
MAELRSDALFPDAPTESPPIFRVTLVLHASRRTEIVGDAEFPLGEHLHDLIRVLDDATTWVDTVTLQQTMVPVVQQVIQQMFGGGGGGLIDPNGVPLVRRRRPS